MQVEEKGDKPLARRADSDADELPLEPTPFFHCALEHSMHDRRLRRAELGEAANFEKADRDVRERLYRGLRLSQHDGVEPDRIPGQKNLQDLAAAVEEDLV